MQYLRNLADRTKSLVNTVKSIPSNIKVPTVITNTVNTLASKIDGFIRGSSKKKDEIKSVNVPYTTFDPTISEEIKRLSKKKEEKKPKTYIREVLDKIKIKKAKKKVTVSHTPEILSKNVHIHTLTINDDGEEPIEFFAHIKPKAMEIIRTYYEEIGMVWLSTKVHYTVEKEKEKGVLEDNTCTNNMTVINSEKDIENVLDKHFASCVHKIGTGSDEKGYGILHSINYYQLYLAEAKPRKGSSYIPTPSKVSAKSVVNIKNEEDEKCFMWCMIASKHPAEYNPDQLFHYNKEQYINEWNFEGIDFPVRVKKDIPKFEKQNNVKINVLTPIMIGQEVRYSVLHLGEIDWRKCINLLLIEKQAEEDVNYILIKNESLKGLFAHYTGKKVKKYP